MELFIVHEAPIARHLSDIAVLDMVATGRIISDAAAQTIAAWWHSPAEPLSTVLSTMGKVDVRMTRETFCPDSEFAMLRMAEQDAANALAAYIRHHIAAAPSGARPCAVSDCMETAVGIVGAVCSQCEETGCEAGETCECEDTNALECGCNATVGCDGGCGSFLSGRDCPCDVLASPPGYRCVHDPVRVKDQHDQGNHGLCVTDRGYCD